IELYNKFLEIDKKNPRYSITLANLYLELGRDEKMRRGNYQEAYSILRKASIYAPNNPDAFYHLSFIFAIQERKWETVIFYGNEALEKGIEHNKKIKLLCNFALAYSRLGYVQKGRQLLNEAYNLDKSLEHE